MQSDKRRQLRGLLRERAVMRGDFVLSSGARSSYYLDARLVTLSAAGAALVGETFVSELPEDVEGAAGLTVGADPIVTAIAICSASRNAPIEGLIVRKEAKSHGAARRIEGPFRAEMRVAVVDDTLTTGASSLEAARAVEQAGGVVLGVWALIDREQGAREAIEEAGYSFHRLFTAAELMTS